MVKAVSKLLVFDKVNKNRNLFPKDIEIKLPERCPILANRALDYYAPSDLIGISSVERDDTGLMADITFCFKCKEFEDLFIKLIRDGKIYIAGYYTAVKSRKEGLIRVIESMRLVSTFITYDDVYGDDELLIKLKED